jgi:sigma-B regulation protein RsbU (phosphoserine phosphatase)
MTISCAGHDFPIIEFKQNQTTSNKDTSSKGAVLGILSGTQYSEAVYQLNEIRSVLLFTDGIYEASNNDDEEWGIENLQQEFKNAHTNHVPSTVQHLYGSATKWMGHTQFQDDVCLLILEIV